MLHYEAQAQQRGDRFGAVLTLTVGEASWTSEWVEAPGATSLAEAAEWGRAQAERLHARVRRAAS